jgi:hypothetical protein
LKGRFGRVHPDREKNGEDALPWEPEWINEPEPDPLFKKRRTSPKRRSEVSFLGIFANLVGLVTFFGCWIFFITTFGWLLGLVLGWIPAVLIALLVAFMSPMILVLLVIIAIILFWAGFSGSFPLP